MKFPANRVQIVLINHFSYNKYKKLFELNILQKAERGTKFV